MLIPRDLCTQVTFQRKIEGRRGSAATKDWKDVATDINVYLTSRRPGSQSGRPEIDFDNLSGEAGQWYWCRPVEVQRQLRLGDRLVRPNRIPLFIIQNDVLGPVQHIILSTLERGR